MFLLQEGGLRGACNKHGDTREDLVPRFPNPGKPGGETTRSHHGTLHGTEPALGPHRISSKALDLGENELGATGP